MKILPGAKIPFITACLVLTACSNRVLDAGWGGLTPDAGPDGWPYPCSSEQLSCRQVGNVMICACKDAAAVDARPPIPDPNGACKPGQRMWCGGATSPGWLQVACDPATGKWKKVKVNGKQVLACEGLLGRRPNTICACYHPFFNTACCERQDCVVPVGTNGQVCPPSSGKLCDYCDPWKPECEPGAMCIVTNPSETYCGRSCDDKSGCPPKYECLTLKVKGGTTRQCVPADKSCYY